MNESVDLHTMTKEELTMDANQANMKALLLAFPIIVLIITPYLTLHLDDFDLKDAKPWLDQWAGVKGVLIALSAMIGGIVAHELIHGIVFAIFARRGFRSVRFGILLKSLTPYCHCSEPLTVSQYRISTVMPSIILGILPSIIAMINGSVPLLLFGMFFTIAAAGDFLILYILRNEAASYLVQDHPEKIGCYIYRPATA